MRKKAAIIASLAAFGVLAVGAGPVPADGMPPGMPDLEQTLKAKPAPARSDTAQMQGMRHREVRMPGEMMQDHRIATREMGTQDGASRMLHRSRGGC